MKRAWLAWGLLGVVVGCASSPAFNAVREGRISVGQAALEAQTEAGEPVLQVARQGVETFFYGTRKRTLSVSFLDGRVIAFDDRAAWPDEVELAGKRARTASTRGAIRVGLTENDVVAALGTPTGITAVDGVEVLHWPSGDEEDTIVELSQGRVVGYADLGIDRFTQNVPRGQRDKATTDGRVRLGMSRAVVEAALGPADGAAANGSRLTHRYESHPVAGHDLDYFVQYDDEHVVAFWQEDLTLAKKQRAVEKREAKRAALAEREQRAARDVGAGRAIFNFLATAAVQQALAARPAQSPTPASRPSSATGGSPPQAATTCSCPELTCKVGGTTARVNSCRATCATPRCSCSGVCEPDRGVLREHHCGCD